jgi:hypothetical protein
VKTVAHRSFSLTFDVGTVLLRAVRRLLSSVIVPLCLVATFVPSTAAQAASKSPIDITPIKATFNQDYFLTDYETTITGEPSAVSAHLKIVWSIKLELVDKAGTPDPEMTAMGMPSGAAVDLGCTNHGDLQQTTHVELSDVEAAKIGRLTTFLWHHPDAADSVPEGWYHCDHELQGPHGHQGLITVAVSVGSWKCVATFKGTHSSLATPANQADPNVKNGTASEPKCTKS